MSTAVGHLAVPGPRQDPGRAGAGPDRSPTAAATAGAVHRAAEAGLRIVATGAWDEKEGTKLPGIAGFIVSSFSPLAAEAARRAMTDAAANAAARTRIAGDDGATVAGEDGAAVAGEDEATVGGGAGRTAVLLVSAFGDVVSARAVAAAVDRGDRVGPLMFFQSVANAIAGHIAASWHLTGPVLAISPAYDALGSGMAEGFAAARLLLDDGDATRVLAVFLEQAVEAGQADRALALLLERREPDGWVPDHGEGEENE